ncbi:hypothetical protein LTR15_000596 [Elasticomyces elasticus]|nr:hypothetical protein LTR15_000596 [Elasticomyces elasticus]
MDSELRNKCHLLALPPELRNRIYEYIFEDEAPPAIDVLKIDLHWPSAALSGTCQQICQETVEMLRAAVLQFKNNHVCIIDIEPLIRNEEDRTRLLQRFAGTGYSSAKLSCLQLRTGNAAVPRMRVFTLASAIVREAPRYAGTATNTDLDALEEQGWDLVTLCMRLQFRSPDLTASRWREHCRDRGISEGLDYKDPRTWDIKDIIRETYTYCSDKATA